MNLETLILPFLIALLAVFYIDPQLVKVAKLKKFANQPNAKKLQKKSVSILGGVAEILGLGTMAASIGTMVVSFGAQTK